MPDQTRPFSTSAACRRKRESLISLRAMKHLPHVQLQIAGDGPQRSELESLARELGLTNVKFAGHVGGKVLDYMIASSRFTVLPSRAYETLGKTILESYAWGRPVIASDLGSRRELVDQGETGLLYPPGNVEQLGKAISFLAERPELAAQMGVAGRGFVEAQHAPEAHYRALMCLYTRMRPWPRKAKKTAVLPSAAPPLRVAFIGGRGMVSKYSGIETYYEEVGKRLVEMGHDVTVYCRSYFTPARPKYEGMRSGSPAHVPVKALRDLGAHLAQHGPRNVQWLRHRALPCPGSGVVFVLSASGGEKDGSHGSGTRLAAKEVGTLCLAHSPPRRTRLSAAAEPHYGRVPDSAAALPDSLWSRDYIRAKRIHDLANELLPRNSWNGDLSRTTTFCS